MVSGGDKKLEKLASIRKWMEQARTRDHLNCDLSNLASSNQWHLDNGVIRHKSKRFFSVTGLTWENSEQRFWQPFLDQPEIGTLGFVVRSTDQETHILCYAKAEPGNTGAIQLAPTCQATRSNLDRVHGGKAPPYADVFKNKQGTIISSSLQSEQGYRFLNKRNLNTVTLCNDIDIEDSEHRWIPLDLFKQLLTADFMVNTDARSVLCTTDWPSLFGRPLFPGNDKFTKKLRASFEATVDDSITDIINRRIQTVRNNGAVVQTCAIDQMPGWTFDPDSGQTVSGKQHAILHIRVHSETREVSDWDQPIFSTLYENQQTLLCSMIENRLRFGFRCAWEPGLYNGAELAPSLEGRLPPEYVNAKTQLEATQSDEGGRFFHDVTHYSIREIDPANISNDLVWLTLSEIHYLLPLGYFNNEARSVLSLILSRA